MVEERVVYNALVGKINTLDEQIRSCSEAMWVIDNNRGGTYFGGDYDTYSKQYKHYLSIKTLCEKMREAYDSLEQNRLKLEDKMPRRNEREFGKNAIEKFYRENYNDTNVWKNDLIKKMQEINNNDNISNDAYNEAIQSTDNIQEFAQKSEYLIEKTLELEKIANECVRKSDWCNHMVAKVSGASEVKNEYEKIKRDILSKKIEAKKSISETKKYYNDLLDKYKTSIKTTDKSHFNLCNNMLDVQKKRLEGLRSDVYSLLSENHSNELQKLYEEMGKMIKTLDNDKKDWAGDIQRSSWYLPQRIEAVDGYEKKTNSFLIKYNEEEQRAIWDSIVANNTSPVNERGSNAPGAEYTGSEERRGILNNTSDSQNRHQAIMILSNNTLNNTLNTTYSESSQGNSSRKKITPFKKLFNACFGRCMGRK